MFGNSNLKLLLQMANVNTGAIEGGPLLNSTLVVYEHFVLDVAECALKCIHALFSWKHVLSPYNVVEHTIKSYCNQHVLRHVFVLSVDLHRLQFACTPCYFITNGPLKIQKGSTLMKELTVCNGIGLVVETMIIL